jgi:hypothetical protein
MVLEHHTTKMCGWNEGEDALLILLPIWFPLSIGLSSLVEGLFLNGDLGWFDK